MTIFCLSHSDYEEYVPFLVAHDSKTGAEWNKDALNAMNTAAHKLVIEHEGGWIGSHDIVKEAVSVLVSIGYIPVKPIETTMQGSGIIENDRDIEYPLNTDIKESVFECNKRVREKLDKELEDYMENNK